MKLKEVLLHKTDVQDLVVFKDLGYYIGCTIIDNDDLFIISLNPRLLDREVENYHYEKETIWNRQKVMIVNLKY